MDHSSPTIPLAGPTDTRDPHELWLEFKSAQDLPTLPEVAIRLQQIIDDPHSSAQHVAGVIEEDPALATKVLRIVNSTFYSTVHGAKITRLSPAIARLGFVAVANIVLSTSVFQAFSKVQRPVFNRRSFWRHSICTGTVASILYDFTADIIEQPLNRDEVHLAGIVHDTGKILFERYANKEFHHAIMSARSADIPVIKEECRFLGVGHDEVGAWLGDRWTLPPQIISVIRWHHDPLACPELQYQPLVKLIHLADYLCHIHRYGDSGNPAPTYDNRVRDEFDLTQDKIDRIIEVAQAEAENSELLLSLAD